MCPDRCGDKSFQKRNQARKLIMPVCQPNKVLGTGKVEMCWSFVRTEDEVETAKTVEPIRPSQTPVWETLICEQTR